MKKQKRAEINAFFEMYKKEKGAENASNNVRTPDGNGLVESETEGISNSRIDNGKAPAEDWKIKMLKCRHSPIRKLPFAFLIIGIPYWLHCELVRHHIGIEKYVKSQRDDRTTDETPRAEKPQGALVNMIIDLNGESILTLMNKRLCGNATREMQELMLMIREEVIKTNPEFKPFLVPMCKYLNSCNEFNSCGKKALYFERGIK